MSRGPDIGTLLVRALYRDSCRAGCPLEIRDSDWARWASATFCGARHVMRWTAAPSPALDAWLATLPDADFILRGHLLADVSVTGISRSADSVQVNMEALTLEE